MKKLKVFSVITVCLSLMVLDLILASCEEPVVKYTVTFDANGGIGSPPPAQTVNAGSSITILTGSTLSKSGYVFGGWNTMADGTGTNYSAGSSFMVLGDSILYAKWNAAFTVTFDINGGSGTTPPAQTVQAGSGITLPSGSGLSRNGYTFGGWNTNDSGTGTNYQSGDSYTPTVSITLYARWLLNIASITIDVKQITDGAPIIEDITISRTNNGYPVTYSVSVDASDYDAGSIRWEVAGVGAYVEQTFTGSNSSFTLDAADVRYNSLGVHALILIVTKDGMQYQSSIPFTIVR
jgi:uncharacterized repeat protein (TIGR02543 family)